MAKLDLLELRSLREKWEPVNVDALSSEDRQKFLSRKMAVDLYIDGVAPQIITEKTNISGSEIIRCTKRCAFKDNSGICKGYAALIPNSHTVKTPDKLHQLFLKYPELETFIIGNYYGDRQYTLEHNMNIRTLHNKFIEKCKCIGIQDYDYPLCLKDKGYVSLYRHVKQMELKLANETIKRIDKNARQKFQSTGYGETSSLIPLAPYGIVQIDGHKIDMIYSVEVENEHGEIILMPATRAWLLAVIDVSTRVIIGYSVSPYENYNQYDVLQAIHNSIVPHKKIHFTHAGFKYPDNGGFPSLAFPEIQWAAFDMIMLDNAKSHLAQHTLEKLIREVKCAVNFGSVATPESRGIIERFFKTIETGGFHRLPGTTGSNIHDTKRNFPEKESSKYYISFNDICELLEYFIAEYNNSAHSSLENQTPLQVMERRIYQAGMYPQIIPASKRCDIEKLTYITVERTLRGGYSSGTKPYVSYLGVKYHAYNTAIPMEFTNQKVFLEVNPDDVSHVNLYNKSGVFIAEMVAMGEWGKRPHSIKTHQAALKRKNMNLEENTPFTPHLSLFEDELRQNAKKSRRHRTNAAIIEKEKEIASKTAGTASPIQFTTPKNSNNIKTYSEEEMELINSMPLEEAYKKGLI